MSLHPVIIAGGWGTRLWPLSREHYPKQFLSIIGSASMLQQTVHRLDGMSCIEKPILVCNEVHRFLVADQLRDTEVTAQEIIIEPEGRNTAPALTLATLRLIELRHEAEYDPLILVMPADHLITDVRAFHEAVEVGMELSEGNRIVTFGVVPKRPETGYGYIKKGLEVGDKSLPGANPKNPCHATEFVEKPDLETAQTYVDSQIYLWNSGIFMMRASVWLSAVEYSRPDIAMACRSAQSNGDTDGNFYRPGKAEFLACPTDSIDYAVMEQSAQMPAADEEVPWETVVVPLDAGWSDVGAWSALFEHHETDSNGNVVQGDVYTQSTQNSLVVAGHRLLATVGIEDTVVVETADAVLVANKHRVQEVKEIVQKLNSEERSEPKNHKKVYRPWGAYEVIDSGPGFQVKRLMVNPNAALSLQMHKHRAEHWIVVVGTARVTIDNQTFPLSQNESTFVPIGMKHRLENPGQVPLEIIEVQTGNYLDEDDIVRFHDSYHRY